MSHFDIRNPAEFSRLFAPETALERLATGFRFVEGPAWLGQGDSAMLVFSDIPSNRIHTWRPGQAIGIFREPSNGANGNTVDPQGRLVTCEHTSRRVTRTESDGTITVLADQFEGKRLNSPNDVVVKSDGAVYFTDPPYGLTDQNKKELPGHYVFRLDPVTGAMRIVADDLAMPNGLCFSPDEKLLYIADSGQPHHVRVYDVQSDGSLANGRIFCTIDPGVPDGIRVDPAGRLFSTAADGVHIYSSDGSLIGKILVPQTTTNVCFGGPDRRTLFVTACRSLYGIQLARLP